MKETDCLIVGCGLSGMVAARTLAEHGYKVHILERRGHIGGNIYDYRDENGFLLQKYGPHTFFTEHKEVKEYIERFTPVKECCLEYVTVIDGKAYPMPFNFKAIDMLYEPERAAALKERLMAAFPGQETVAVAALVGHEDELISEYGRFMYENEYRLYTAKQWGRPIETISPDVFGRVPVYLSYKWEYEPHPYQFVPEAGFTDLARRMLDHPNITCELEQDALAQLELSPAENAVFWHRGGVQICCPILYTGALDELFAYEYGRLPYRSLEFIWKTLPKSRVRDVSISAWPQAEVVTRVTNYANLPKQQQQSDKTVVAIEIPFEYDRSRPFGNEPYYPIRNEETAALYDRYRKKAESFSNLYPAGRLADYKYYNMDQAILSARQTAQRMIERLSRCSCPGFKW